MDTIKVLDHGFVTLRNISGPTRRIMDSGGVEGQIESFRPFDADDVDPANTARMSFNQIDSGRKRSEDLRLATYLMAHKHTTPFEMIEVWLEMKLPIFVARQFVRHRTVSINEVSGRYVTLPKEWYIPTVVGAKPENAKQGQSNTLSASTSLDFRVVLSDHCTEGYSKYLWAIENGVAPEHARMFLSLNHYTHWVWKQDLHNLMHFLSLRDHSHAQVEAQEYAKAIDTLIRHNLPHSMSLYDLYRRQG